MKEVDIVESKWWHDLLHGVFGPRQGGARIIIDAEDAATGSGKTGLAVTLARLLGEAFQYELRREDFTLSGKKYLDRWREHPGAEQPSVVVLDELGGAGAGHARRAMSGQNVDLGNSWQLMRKKRIVSIVTLPHWSKADKDMRMQADYRLWAKRRPIGYFIPFRVKSSFDEGSVRTKGYEDVDQIAFPNVDRLGDPLYEHVTAEKDELLDSQYFDADKLYDEDEEEEVVDPEDVRREEQIKQALRLVEPWSDDSGMTYLEAAQKLDYGKSWIANRVSEWRNGMHENTVDETPA